MGSKNAQKILEHDTKSASTTIKAIKNDRAAEQIAGAIGNGNQDVKAKVSENLKKSKGGKGVNVQQHVSAGNYNASGVKQNVIATKNSNSAARSRMNGFKKQINDLENKNIVQNQMAEARERKLKAGFDRELEKAKNSGKSTYRPYQHKNGYAPKPTAVTNSAGKKTLKKGLEFIKNPKIRVGLGVAGLTAAGATGAYLYNKKKNQ